MVRQSKSVANQSQTQTQNQNQNRYIYSVIKKWIPDTTSIPDIPVIDLANPDAKYHLVKACQDFGFFKVVNHGIPFEFMTSLETEASKFFFLPQSEKDKAGPPAPFGYGSKRIGRNGDIGWIEYLLLRSTFNEESLNVPDEIPNFCSFPVYDYVTSVKKMGCEVVELIAEGLQLEDKNVFSKLLMDEESDSVFRLNHYPPRPDVEGLSERDLVGFGEHTDPQIISILRSNNATGLQICLKDGSWVSVSPDESSFFIIVGDSLQVLTNSRFESVKHRVLANSDKSRISMIYFAAPPPRAKIVPLKSLMEKGEQSLYKEFTWSEYKSSTYMSRLADNRLSPFMKD